MKDEILDKGGEFIVKNLFDKGLNNMFIMMEGGFNAPPLQDLQNDLMQFSQKQKDIIKDLVINVMTAATHDFLFRLQEESDALGEVSLRVDGEDIGKHSDGLHGEIFTEEGWLSRYSKYADHLKHD